MSDAIRLQTCITFQLHVTFFEFHKHNYM